MGSNLERCVAITAYGIATLSSLIKSSNLSTTSFVPDVCLRYDF